MGKKSGGGRGPVTLCIDIGGTGVKAMLVAANGTEASKRIKEKTPKPSTPKAVFGAMEAFRVLKGYDRVSVGFPGVISDGVAKTAHNLGDEQWRGVDVQKAVRALFGKPTRAANDADLQGFGLIEGRGLELILTLGTGVGSGLYLNGVLVPNLELGHAAFEKGKTYEQRLGKRALDKTNKKEWRKRLTRAIDKLRPVFNWRLLHIGGGHAELVKGMELPADVRVGSNVAGLLGGVALWRDE